MIHSLKIYFRASYTFKLIKFLADICKKATPKPRRFLDENPSLILLRFIVKVSLYKLACSLLSPKLIAADGNRRPDIIRDSQTIRKLKSVLFKEKDREIIDRFGNSALFRLGRKIDSVLNENPSLFFGIMLIVLLVSNLYFILLSGKLLTPAGSLVRVCLFVVALVMIKNKNKSQWLETSIFYHWLKKFKK